MANLLTIPSELRTLIYDEVFQASTAVQLWLQPRTASESVTEQPDDWDAEVHQVRKPVRRSLPDAMGATMGAELLDLLIHPAPGFALRQTSKSIRKESEDAYKAACANIAVLRKQLYRVLVEEFSAFVENGKGFNIRTFFSSWCLQALADPEDYVEKEEDLEHAREHTHVCEHSCPGRDPFLCFCAEHEACFGCGRWLAMAWFFETYPHARTPKLVRDDGTLMHLGRVIEENTKLRLYEKNNLRFHGLPERFVMCEFEQLKTTGEAWWRFELERQKIEIQAGNLHAEVQRALFDGGAFGPNDRDPPEADLKRWLDDFDFLKTWNRWINENEREAHRIEQVDDLQQWLHLLDSERVPYAVDPVKAGGGSKGGCCVQ